MSSKFSDNCYNGFRQNFRMSCKILEGQPQKFIGWTRPFLPLIIFPSSLICVRCLREGGRFNYFRYFENHKSYDNTCIVNTSRCQILISGCKVFCLFQQIFVCEKVKKWIVLRKKITSTPQPPASFLSLILV